MKTRDDSIELCNLLSLLVRAMVSASDTVSVTSSPSPCGPTMIQIKVAEGRDVGKIIGKQGRTAHSLRIIVQAIGKQQGQDYHIDIQGATIDLASPPQQS
jgi:predicted RNA-binding protein YlqC (UPF0109 family)